MRYRVLGAAIGAYVLEGSKRKRQNVITCVPPEQPLLLAQIKIDALVELVDISTATKVLNEVVCLPRLIRKGEVA